MTPPHLLPRAISDAELAAIVEQYEAGDPHRAERLVQLRARDIVYALVKERTMRKAGLDTIRSLTARLGAAESALLVARNERGDML